MRVLLDTNVVLDSRVCLQRLEVLSVDRQTLVEADALPGNDFEDNVQIASAVESAVDALVTRDSSGFAQAPLQVWSPSELLQQLSQRP